MKQKFVKAFNELKKAGAPVYEHVDDRGNFSIDAEAENGTEWNEYYSMFENETQKAILRKYSLFAEWVNPGRLSVYEA